MGFSGFNALDLAVFGSMAISGYLAHKRGLVKEVLALGTWVLAAIITVSCYPMIKPIVAQHVKSEMAVDAASAIVLFCITIIALVPLGNYLTSLIKGPNMTAIDQALGFVFGIVRGFLILSLLYLCGTFLWPEDGHTAQPVWLEQARTKPLLAYGAEVLKAVVPFQSADQLEEQVHKSQENAADTVEDANKRLERLSTPTPSRSSGSSSTPSYDQDKLKDLIDRKVSP